MAPCSAVSPLIPLTPPIPPAKPAAKGNPTLRNSGVDSGRALEAALAATMPPIPAAISGAILRAAIPRPNLAPAEVPPVKGAAAREAKPTGEANISPICLGKPSGSISVAGRSMGRGSVVARIKPPPTSFKV